MLGLRHSARGVVVLVIATRVTATSAGVLYTTDLDAVGLGQAGAYVAAPATAAAVWYNPAGLAAQRGLRVALEGGLISSPLSGDLTARTAGTAPTPFDNQHPLLPAGLVGVSWDFGLRDLTAGLFAYVPSSSTYKYDPQGAQRFQGVGGDYLLAFFHAAVAYRLWGKLSIGLAFGPTYFQAGQANSVSAAPAGFDPHADVLAVGVETDVASPLFLTANLGVSFSPTPRWSMGASVMPAFDIHSSGTMTLTPSSILADLATIAGNTVKVDLQFPTVARAGVRFAPRPGLALELAGVYEGWSRFRSIDLRPDITVSAPSFGIATMKIAPISLIKGYRDVYSARLGGEVAAGPRVTLRAGSYFESSGSPTSRFDITAPEANKVGLTLGATIRVRRWLEVDLAYAHTFFPEVTVTDSALQIRDVLQADNTATIGNGSYRMSLDFFHLGLRFQR